MPDVTRHGAKGGNKVLHGGETVLKPRKQRIKATTFSIHVDGFSDEGLVQSTTSENQMC